MTQNAVDISQRLEALAAFEPSPFPVLSLYLDLSANQHGRGDYDAFVRKVLPDRMKGLPDESAERQSFEQDAERIRKYLDTDISASSNGLAIFASAGSDL